MKKILYLIVALIFISGCFHGKKRKMTHVEYPDKSPAEIAEEKALMGDVEDLPELEPLEENKLETEGDVIEAESEGDEGGATGDEEIGRKPKEIKLDGDGKITITRDKTNEKITVRYRKKDGSYDQDALDKIKHVMRCYDDNGTEHEIAPSLIEFADLIDDHFGRKGLVMLSGYRTPEHNRKEGGAKGSYHTLGWAVDIKIPGISVNQLYKYAAKISKSKDIGGVGHYRTFIHIDVRGSYRPWDLSKKKQYKKRKNVRRKTVQRKPAAKKPVVKKPAKKNVKAAPKKKPIRANIKPVYKKPAAKTIRRR